MIYKSWDDRVIKTFCQDCKEFTGFPYHCDSSCKQYKLASEMAEMLDSLAYVFENITKNGGDK